MTALSVNVPNFGLAGGADAAAGSSSAWGGLVGLPQLSARDHRWIGTTATGQVAWCSTP
jgi:hypothetical protein